MTEKPADLCPLCGKSNACEQMVCGDKITAKNCWCQQEDIIFPDDLLERLPIDERNKRCICRQCLLAFQCKDIS